MSKNIFSKKRAFTLAETLISVTVIAFIGAITICSTLSSSNQQEKNIKTTSALLYSEFESAYQNILLQDTNNYNITKLKNVDDFEQDASEVLKERLSDYMDLTNQNCNSLPYIEGTTSPYLNEVSACAYSNRGYDIAINLKDKNCSSSYQVKNYYQDSVNTSIVDNACGYIVYATNRSKGVIGRDFFIIGLGKRKLL